MGAAKKLGRNVWVGERLFMAGDAPDKEFADQITNPKAWEESEDSTEPKGLDDMDAGELKEELSRRNASRSEADAIQPDGNGKAKLLEALKADDAANQA